MTLVLAYHHVSPTRSIASTRPEVLDAHLACLRAAGYAIVSYAEFESLAAGGFRGAASRTALVTFDDGHVDNWIHAAPVLRACGAPATMFVITAAVDDGPVRNAAAEPQLAPGEDEDRAFRVRWSELRAWADGGGLAVQSHSHGHRNWRRVLAGTTRPAQLPISKARSTTTFASRSARSAGGSASFPSALAWPWGFSSAPMRDVASRVGLRLQFGVVPGLNGPWSAPDRLHRVTVDGWPPGRLARWLSRMRWSPAAAAWSVLRDTHRRLRP